MHLLHNTGFFKGVNLPRWGLKHKVGLPDGRCIDCVNLPRWGLKHSFNVNLPFDSEV